MCHLMSLSCFQLSPSIPGTVLPSPLSSSEAALFSPVNSKLSQPGELKITACQSTRTRGCKLTLHPVSSIPPRSSSRQSPTPPDDFSGLGILWSLVDPSQVSPELLSSCSAGRYSWAESIAFQLISAGF